MESPGHGMAESVDPKEVKEMHEEEEKAEVAKDFFMSESEATGETDPARTVKEEVDDAESKPKLEDPQAEHSAGISDGIASEALDEKKGVDWPEKAAALKNFVKERGSAVSSVIRKWSIRKEELDQVPEVSEDGQKGLTVQEGGDKKKWPSLSFLRPTELELLAKPSSEADQAQKLAGRITVFTRSGCPDSRLVRAFLREKSLPFTEVNLDLFPQRGLDLEERSGTSSVPQVFFNEELVGGVEELTALQKSGELDEKIRKVLDNECPETGPSAPVREGEDGDNAVPDEFTGIVRQLRDKMQLKDRFSKLRLFNSCFVGSDAVDLFGEDQYSEREEAVEFGRKVAAKHFFHHVSNENVFEDGNHFYRFLEHDPAVAKCLNFFGATNDCEPKPAADVCKRLVKLIQAMYDRYISEDGSRVDYYAIATSDEFRRYVKLTEELHRIDMSTLTREEKLSFFLNIHNAMVIHSFILYGRPKGTLERKTFFAEIQYVIGGYAYSLSAIENGILRANRRPPYNITKDFGGKDPRLQVSLKEPEPLVHFALSYGARSSPALRCYSPEGVDTELRLAARDFFNKGGIGIDTETRTVTLSKIMKWFNVDFGKNEREVLHWIAKHIDPTKAEHLLSLMEDSSQVKINYSSFDWSPNV